jgi:hypothetical protein
LWIEHAALECWQTIGPSGQARYTGAAIQTSLMLRAAFKLPLRQIEDLMTSVLSLMGFTISAPDHTTVSRRAMTLPVLQAVSIAWGCKPKPPKIRQVKFSPGTIASKSITCPLSRKV